MSGDLRRTAKDLLANRLVKRLLNHHSPGSEGDVLLFATPRGGSTWLMELIWSQPRFKICTEPLDLRNPLVRAHLGFDSWQELYDPANGERLVAYLSAFRQGRLHISEPLPLRGKYFRLRTSRIVYKLLHGAEDRIGLLAERLSATPVLLLRHPIPVSLSRKELPRLETLLYGSYRRHFSTTELRFAERIFVSGSPLQLAVLDWCLQNTVPLRAAEEHWLVVTYEQLVLEPETVIPILARRLNLPDSPRMLARIGEASSVTHQSDPSTRRLLSSTSDQSDRRQYLVRRWQERVSTEEMAQVAEILDRFGIDAYRAGDALPNGSLMLGGATESAGGETVSSPPGTGSGFDARGAGGT